jgi:ATP-dependent RNA helicase MRH4
LGEKGLDHLAWTGEAEQRILGKNGALDGFLKPVTAALSSAGARSSEGIPSGGEGKQQDIAPSEVGVSFGAPRVLVTTSLLSRGLDFAPFVSTVVLVDPPRDALDFVHRAGRAGRAGRTGRVIVFGMGDGRDLGGRGGVGKGVKEVVRKGKGHGRVSGGSTAGGRREGSRPRIARR